MSFSTRQRRALAGGKNWKSARKDYKNKKKAVKKLEKKSETLAENIKSTNKKINELKTNSPNLFNKLDNAVNEYGETVDIYFTSENVSFGNDGENKLKFDTETMNFAFGGMLFKFEFVRLTTIDFGVNTTEVSTKNVPSGDRTTLEVSKHELGHADYHIENTYKYYKYLQNKGILDQNGNVIRSYDGHDSDDQSDKRANKYDKLNDL